MTATDDEIRLRDLPERFQLRYGSRVVTEKQIEDEARWIADHPKFQTTDAARIIDIAATVENILKFIHIKHLEIPFIIEQRQSVLKVRSLLVPALISFSFFLFFFFVFFRRDYFAGYLERKDLWLIYELDEKWMNLCDKKSKLTKLFETLKEETDVTDYYFEDLLAEYKDEEGIKDLIDYFKQHYSPKMVIS